MSETPNKRDYEVRTVRGVCKIKDIINITWESEPGVIMFYDSATPGDLPVFIAPLRDTVVEEVK